MSKGDPDCHYLKYRQNAWQNVTEILILILSVIYKTIFSKKKIIEGIPQDM